MKSIIQFALRNIPRKYLQLFTRTTVRILQVFYIGNNVECPVCGHTYRKLLPYGRIKSRENALCPNCLSLERHRLLWLYINQKTNLFTGKNKMLHIAPEICFMDRFESIEGLEYITGDIESPLAKVKMDIHKIPFEDNTFDVSMCNHVMEHVTDDIAAMKEIYRVLKPGGWAIIQVPFFPPLRDLTFEDDKIKDLKEREKVFGQDDHVRMYGLDYGQRLSKAGFKVTEDDFINSLDKGLVKRYALPENEIIYFVTKKN